MEDYNSNAAYEEIWPRKATNNDFVPTMPPGKPANFLIASIDAVATCSLLHNKSNSHQCYLYPTTNSKRKNKKL